MKKSIFAIFVGILMNCGDSFVENSCFNNAIHPLTFDLNNPQLNALLTPNGAVEVNGGMNGIVIFNKGTGGSFSPYIALDRKCPNKDCSQAMTSNVPILECPCDGSKYSMLNGSLISGENSCNGGARVYSVRQSGSTLQISN